MNLTAENVISIFENCLMTVDDENIFDIVMGEGIMGNANFNPERLKGNEQFICDMLNDLPDSFKKDGGGGMSFLNMCQDKNDRQWADLHQTMDMLVCLGNSIGKLSFLMPRDMWSMLPGGMPYIVVL